MKVDWRKLIGFREKSPELLSPGQSGQGNTRFPSSAGDREKGKFRESAFPGLSIVALSNDDGTPITSKVETMLGGMDGNLVAIREFLAPLKGPYSND